MLSTLTAAICVLHLAAAYVAYPPPPPPYRAEPSCNGYCPPGPPGYPGKPCMHHASLLRS